MTDYIKRDDAIKWLKNLFDDCGNYMPLWHYGEVLPKIIELLEVDVAPVRHGRWEAFEDMMLDTCYRCSECGREFYLADCSTPQENEYNYCPNCGAKMDEEAEK